MWGSDFPHHDSTFPRSRAVLDEIFEDVPDEERFMITAGNCRDLYHLPFEDQF
jgi:predicted TIM-barrel fold metal-dependent hydrolase